MSEVTLESVVIVEGCGGQLRVLRVVLESMELEVLLSSLKPP